jgi:PIN domain nuclease of toxin-antitoxin system
MMKILLDTHVLLWWLDKPGSLSAAAYRAIADRDNTVFVSAASIWEITIKKSIGKLVISDDFEAAIQKNAFVHLPVTSTHAFGLTALPDFHRDPFDRMLVAQSICEGMTIVTRDPNIIKYPASWMMA